MGLLHQLAGTGPLIFMWPSSFECIFSTDGGSSGASKASTLPGFPPFISKLSPLTASRTHQAPVYLLCAFCGPSLLVHCPLFCTCFKVQISFIFSSWYISLTDYSLLTGPSGHCILQHKIKQQPNCSLLRKWIKKMCVYIYMMEYYSTTKRIEQPAIWTGMNELRDCFTWGK